MYVLLWHILPGLLYIIVPDLVPLTPARFFVDDLEYSTAFAVESICLVAAFGSFLKIAMVRGIDALNTSFNSRPSRRFLYLLYAGTVIYAVWILPGELTKTYLDRNSADIYVQRDFFESFAIGLLIASIIGALLNEERRTRDYYVLWGCILLFVTIKILGGGRIWLVLPLLLVALRADSLSSLKLSSVIAAKMAVAVLVFATIAIPVAFVSGKVRTGESSGFHTIAEMSLLAYENAAIGYFTKYDFVSAGYGLIKFDGVGVAGLKPYIGSMLVLIPRSVWPDKPVSGSVDGSISGHPSRIIPRLAHIYSDSIVFGYSPALATVWQFGWLGLIVFILSVPLFLHFVNFLLFKSFYSCVIGIYLLSMPTLHTLIASADVLLMRCMLILPLFLLSEYLTRGLRTADSASIKPYL